MDLHSAPRGFNLFMFRWEVAKANILCFIALGFNKKTKLLLADILKWKLSLLKLSK